MLQIKNRSGRFKMGPRLNTITNTTLASATFNGNGATTAFATGFQFLQNADLRVVETSSAGVETVKTLTTHYTVTGAGNPSGGTVTMLVAPATGTKLNINSNVTLDQQTDYQEGGSFAASTHETALDKLTKAVQQVKEITDRSLKLPVSNQSITAQTPVITADYVLGVNSGGTALEWKSPSTIALGSTVSAYAATLLDDADASAARTTLGLGTVAVESIVPLAKGGTGVSLTDPGADRIMFWDDSAGQTTWLTPGTNLTITGTTLDAASTATDTFKTIAVSGQSDVVADSSTDTLTLVAGSGMTITTNAGTDEITFASSGGASAASQAEQETASSTAVYVTPGRQQYHPSAAKAWCSYTSITTTAIVGSYNITSLTDNAVGWTTVTIATDFSDTTYSAVASSQAPGAGAARVCNVFTGVSVSNYSPVAPLVGSYDILTSQAGVGFEDAIVTTVAFGDQ